MIGEVSLCAEPLVPTAHVCILTWTLMLSLISHKSSGLVGCSSEGAKPRASAFSQGSVLSFFGSVRPLWQRQISNLACMLHPTDVLSAKTRPLCVSVSLLVIPRHSFLALCPSRQEEEEGLLPSSVLAAFLITRCPNSLHFHPP